MTARFIKAPGHARFGVLGEFWVGNADLVAKERREQRRTSKYEGGWCRDCKERAGDCQCAKETWFGECMGGPG